MAKVDDVVIVKVKNSLIDGINEILKKLRINLKNKDNIIIKPNLCSYLHSSTGATTDPRVVEALIKIIQNVNKNADVKIIESDSGGGKKAEIAFELLGYKHLEEKYKNVQLINLSKDKITKKTMTNSFLGDFLYPDVFYDEHFFISIPKLKTFEGDYLTCALKNQFGCNPDPDKWKHHPHLSEVIYDLNRLFKPDLVIVDGIIAMEGFGHVNGIPKKMDLIIGGTQPASVDVVSAKIMGINYKEVKHIKFALNAGGLGTDQINIIGRSIQSVEEKFLLPKNRLKVFVKSFLYK